MLRIGFIMKDDREKEEMMCKEVMRLVTENGIQLESLEINHMKGTCPELQIKEIQIPEFMKKKNAEHSQPGTK